MADDIGILNSLAIPLSKRAFLLESTACNFLALCMHSLTTCARKDQTAGTKQTWRPAAEVKVAFVKKVVMQDYVTKHALAY